MEVVVGVLQLVVLVVGLHQEVVVVMVLLSLDI